MSWRFRLFPSWSVIFGFVIGAVVGSFLNMAIWRLPRQLSFINPSKSFCPKCNHPLEAADLIPLFSWLSTGGKCRYCKEPVASRYFYVELLTAILFSALWWQYFIAQEKYLLGGFYALCVAGLVAVIYIDWELFIIPDELNAYLLLVGIAFRLFDHSMLEGLKGALAGWGLLWGIAFLGRVGFGKDAMGHGDIKMMRGIGFLVGAPLLGASLAMAVVLGLVFGILFIVLAKMKDSRTPSVEADGQSLKSEEEFPPPESIGSLLKFGVWYLLALDVIALPFPGLYRLIGETPVQEEVIDEDWKPTLTTIPFGPYLAAGVIVCLLFAEPISAGINNWWRNATGSYPAASAASINTRERFIHQIPSQIYGEEFIFLG